MRTQVFYIIFHYKMIEFLNCKRQDILGFEIYFHFVLRKQMAANNFLSFLAIISLAYFQCKVNGSLFGSLDRFGFSFNNLMSKAMISRCERVTCNTTDY